MLGMIDAGARRETRLLADIGGGADADTAVDYTTEGLFAGTRIATEAGWCAVERVSVGDRVPTFDNGLQTVVEISRLTRPLGLPTYARPVHVPARALGNNHDLVLLPDQSVMVESDAAEALFGDPFAVLKARDVVGFRNITRIAGDANREVVNLHFAAHEVLRIEGGALIVADADVPGRVPLEQLASIRLPAPYSKYSGQAARCLVAAMTEEDARLGEGGSNRPAA